MGRSKDAKEAFIAQYTLPKAPFLYINDPTVDAAFASKLTQLIPKTLRVTLAECPDHSGGYLATMRDNQRRDTVYIFIDSRSDEDALTKRVAANLVRQAAIRVGSNFASVNFLFDENMKSTKWNSNHADFVVTGRPEYVTVTEVQEHAEKVYRWLFTVLTVKDTLHLISDEEMLKVDKNAYLHGYQYSRISDCQKFGKDAKIQFVGLIVSKPTVTSEKKLTWQIADKSGVTNFYFKWRGPSSQSTWDWVLSMEPGQRRCLPRMPCVLVKENLLTTVAKAPVRVPGSVLRGTGNTICLVGYCVHKVGKLMKMGKRKKWVEEADTEAYLDEYENIGVVPVEGQSTVSVFTEKATKTWNDKDSSHSTLQDEVTEKNRQLYDMEI